MKINILYYYDSYIRKFSPNSVFFQSAKSMMENNEVKGYEIEAKNEKEN